MTHNSLTLGYLDGVQGKNPNTGLSYPGSDYEEGWLMGYEHRRSGLKLPKYHGYHRDEDLPIKPGMIITIKKGTMVRCNGETKPAGRTYKVKVNHVLPGSDMYVHGNAFRREVHPLTPPKVRWAGSGGYWAEVDINDIPEAG